MFRILNFFCYIQIMSRLLGIDYGAKRIGLAITDEKRQFAFPYDVIENNKRTMAKISQIIKEKNIKKIVLGLPLSIEHRPQNPILKSAQKFKKELEESLKIKVDFESEVFSTKAAERIQGRHAKIDASAASLILESYLRRHSQSKNRG